MFHKSIDFVWKQLKMLLLELSFTLKSRRVRTGKILVNVKLQSGSVQANGVETTKHQHHSEDYSGFSCS